MYADNQQTSIKISNYNHCLKHECEAKSKNTKAFKCCAKKQFKFFLPHTGTGTGYLLQDSFYYKKQS